MILISKTLASLEENNYGNFGRIRMLAHLKVCEIKYNLPHQALDSLKALNGNNDNAFTPVGILPWLMEHGTKEVQLESVYLLAKVHMKLAALKLDRAPSAGDMED